jgi:hypothetical protein
LTGFYCFPKIEKGLVHIQFISLFFIMSDEKVTRIHGYVQQMENAMLAQRWDEKFSLGFVCPYLKAGTFIEKCFQDHGFDVYTLDLYELRWRFSENIEQEVLREIAEIQDKVQGKAQPLIFLERLDGIFSKHHVHILPWLRDGIKTVNAQGEEVFVPVIVYSREFFGPAFEQAFTNEARIEIFETSIDHSLSLERLHEKRREKKEKDMEELYHLDYQANQANVLKQAQSPVSSESDVKSNSLKP